MNPAYTIFAIVPFIIFLAMFGRPRTKWWRDPAGVSVFILSAVVVAVLSLVVCRYVFHWVPPAWVREGIYTSIGLAGWVQLAAYAVTRRAYRRDQRQAIADALRGVTTAMIAQVDDGRATRKER